jgi:hypothetical protein
MNHGAKVDSNIEHQFTKKSDQNTNLDDDNYGCSWPEPAGNRSIARMIARIVESSRSTQGISTQNAAGFD